MHFFACSSVLRLYLLVSEIALMLMAIPICVYAKEKLRVELVTVGSARSTINFSQLTYMGPPMSVAVDHVNKMYNESLNVTLKYLFDDMPWANMLPHEYNHRLASQWYYRERNPKVLCVFLIPSGVITADLSHIFQQWNVLFVSVISVTPAIGDRIANPTWISTAWVNYPAMTMLFCEVLLKYKWSTFMVLWDIAASGMYRPYADQIVKDSVERMGRAPLFRKISVTSSYNFQPLLEDIRAHTRIVVFLGPGGAVRNFLIAASKANMTNGDYVYMAFEMKDSQKLFLGMQWEYHDDNDQIAQQAFQSLLIMRPADTSGTPKKDLAEAIFANAQRDFNYTYDMEDFPYLQMLSSYGAVTALAEVLDDLWMDDNEHPYQNGTFLAEHFLNRTFDNNVSQIYIDDKGGRQIDFYLWRFAADGSQNKFLYKRAAGNTPVTEMYQIQRWINGTWPPPNEPFCGYNNNLSICLQEGKTFSAAAPVVPIVAACMIIAAVAAWQIRRIKQKILTPWWRISPSQLEYDRVPPPLFVFSRKSVSERKSVSTRAVHQYLSEKFISARLDGIDVIMEISEKTTEEATFDRLASDPSFLSDMNKMRNVNHQNISRLCGISSITAKTYAGIGIIMEQPARGCIYDVFDGLISLDVALISSLMSDFLEGVHFIHSSPLGYHGSLCGLYCHVDKNFTLKICGLVNSRLKKAMLGSNGKITYMPSRAKRETLSAVFDQKADMYAVGVVLWELLAEQRFFSMDGLEQISATKAACIQEYREVLALCWLDDIYGRPSVKKLRENLARKSAVFTFRHSEHKYIDTVQHRLSGYTRELENEVGLRTKNLVDETNRCNEIVAQLLPRWVANEIRSGNPIPAEFFECVTLMFTQICGFANLLRGNEPKRIIDVISESDLFVDRLIHTFVDEIYKVEVVDDCFLMASGLQLKIGDRHAQVTAQLAIEILQSTPQLFARHGLQFKSGIHSGPCAAGIAGFRRLRYCLFGDTVNTASRMCSYGEPSRTQMSESTTMLIAKTGLFEAEPRGVMSIKGKTEMLTYWLNGYKE